MTLVIKKVDQRTLRDLKAEAARRGLTLAEVFQEAANLWLTRQEETPVLTETQRNNEFYESNVAELERQYKGRYLLIAGARLVGAYDDLRAAAEAMRALSPKPRHAILTKIGKDAREYGEWLGGSLEQ
ncbi:hypothetical protein [[Eubacterium] cellulosolvens]